MREPVYNRPHVLSNSLYGKRIVGCGKVKGCERESDDFYGLLHLLVRAMQKHDQQRVPTKSGRRLFQPSFRLCKI